MTETAKKWKQVPWLRIGAEAVAIIASILIAFPLDAWWDRHQSAQQEESTACRRSLLPTYSWAEELSQSCPARAHFGNPEAR